MLLHTAYAAFRPAEGLLESARMGRQYVDVAETFHVDGASATTRPSRGDARLRWTAWGGVPVHLYERSAAGDWIAGLRAAANPWKGGRASLDWVHDEDRLSLLGTAGRKRSDLGALALGQRTGVGTDLAGRFTWLGGPRDASLRATLARPEDRLLVQASAYRLLSRQRQEAADLDAYTSVLTPLERYQQLDLRASRGLGEHLDLEAGGGVRRVLPGERESPFNRDVDRWYATPSLTGLPWEGITTAVTAEAWTGAGGRVRTWSGEIEQRFADGTRLSAGTDYSLYAFGVLRADERSHVRSEFLRLRTPLSASLSLDARCVRERDDDARFHEISLALVLEF